MRQFISRKQPAHAGIGAASIIMIFMVLCLTALGVLSLSSARADRKLAVKRLEYIERYYAAEAEIQHQLAAAYDAQSAGEITLTAMITGDQHITAAVAIGENGEIRVLSHRVINDGDWDQDAGEKWNTGPDGESRRDGGDDSDFLFE